MSDISISQIRNMHEAFLGKPAAIFLVRYVLYPLSYPLAWLFLKMKVTANQLTIASLLLGFIGCILIAFGPYNYLRILGSLLIFMWILLDHVDGHIARCTNSISKFGHFLDCFGTWLIGPLIFFSLGISAYVHPDSALNSMLSLVNITGIEPSWFLFLGGWIAVGFMLPALEKFELNTMFEGTNATIKLLEGNTLPMTIIKRIRSNICGLSSFELPMIILACIYNFVSIYLIIWAIIHSIDGIGQALYIYLSALRRKKLLS